MKRSDSGRGGTSTGLGCGVCGPMARALPRRGPGMARNRVNCRRDAWTGIGLGGRPGLQPEARQIVRHQHAVQLQCRWETVEVGDNSGGVFGCCSP